MSEGLVFEGITKRYGGVVAVDQVDLSIASGQVFGIVGPNGAGKSTLVDMATGFIAPSKGRVQLDGHRLSGASSHRVAAAGVARTFQHTSLFQGCSVRENLQIAQAAAKQVSTTELDEVLEACGLAAEAEAQAAALPYGAQRRLAVALALVSNPVLLMLDEPAAGMNPVESAEFVELINNVRRDRTVVLIEHDMSVIRALCTRTAVMVDGRLLTEGMTSDVLGDPRVVDVYLGVGS